MATQNEKDLAKAHFFDAGYGNPEEDTLTLAEIKERNPFSKKYFSHILQVSLRILFGTPAFNELKDFADRSKTVVVPFGGSSKNIGGSRILVTKRRDTV